MSNPQPVFGRAGADATSVHRSLSKTKGVSQTSFAVTGAATTATQSTYVTKFISDPLVDITTIDAADWSSQTAKSETNLNSNYQGGLYCLYVWRPSTNARVGNSIYPFTGEGGFAEPSSINTQRLGTGIVIAGVLGAQVTGVQDGDVIICEVYFRKTQSSSTAFTDSWYYNGGTTYDGGSNQDIVSDMASFIQTPQDLTFVTDTSPPIAMNVTDSRTVASRFITKV